MSSSYKAAPLMLLSRWVFKLWLRWGHKESEFVLHCFLTDNKGGCLRFWKEVWPLFKSNHRYLYKNNLRSLHPGIFKTLMSLELLWVVMFFFSFFFCKLWKSIVKICVTATFIGKKSDRIYVNAPSECFLCWYLLIWLLSSLENTGWAE